jgi:hypothetical protein
VATPTGLDATGVSWGISGADEPFGSLGGIGLSFVAISPNGTDSDMMGGSASSPSGPEGAGLRGGSTNTAINSAGLTNGTGASVGSGLEGMPWAGDAPLNASGPSPTGGGMISASHLPVEDFLGPNPFPLRSGPLVGALTTSVIPPGQGYTQSGGDTITTWGVDESGIGYATTTEYTYSFTVGISNLPDGGVRYSEIYSYTYDANTTPVSVGGVQAHTWGSSWYTFIADQTDAESSFHLTAGRTDDETSSLVRTAPGTSSTLTWNGTQHQEYHRQIDSHTDLATGAVGGSDSGSGWVHSDWWATGNYSVPLADGVNTGVVQGTLGGTGSQDFSFGYSTSHLRSSSGAVTRSGNWNERLFGSEDNWYSGSGSYSVSDASDGVSYSGNGTVSESGRDSYSHDTNASFTLGNDGAWSIAGGAGSGTASGYGASSYEASGGYSYPFVGSSVQGGWQFGAGDREDYLNRTNSTLMPDGLWLMSGTGEQSGSGWRDWSYSGSGSYMVNLTDGGRRLSGSGNVTESGGEHHRYRFDTRHALNPGGAWTVVSGSGSASGDGSDSWSYGVSGDYSYMHPTGTVSGTWRSSGGNQGDHRVQIDSTLQADGTWAAAGFADRSGSGAWDWSYSGSGSYSVNSASGGVTYTGLGTLSESGGDAGSFAYSASYALAAGDWQTTAESGSASGSGSKSWSFSASGGYSYALPSGSVSGTWQTSGADSNAYRTRTDSQLLAGGIWSSTGMASNSGSGNWDWSYSGSGSFSLDVASDGLVYSGGATVNESGRAGYGYSYAASYDLAADGATWQPLSGSGSGSGSGYGVSIYSGSGSYSRPFGFEGNTLRGTWQANGSDRVDYSTQTFNTLRAENTWSSSASASGSGSGSWGWSYSGSGSYSVNDAGPDVTYRGSGTLSESGSNTYKYGYAATYGLAPDGTTWEALGGSGSGSASGYAAWSNSANGNYTATIPGGTVNGTWRYSASDRNDYGMSFGWSLERDRFWALRDGSASSSGSGGWAWSYLGSGSYSVAQASGGISYSGGGTVAESGGDTWSYGYSARYALQADGLTWSGAGGSGSASGSGSKGWSYSANGNYSYPITGGTVAGTWRASGGASSGYQTSVNSTLKENTFWSSSGTASTSGSGNWDWSYSGSGSYAVNAISAGVTYTGSGTVRESAGDAGSFSFSARYTLGEDGLTWLSAGGSGSGSGSGYGSWSYSASGDYSYLVVGGNVAGTWQASGGNSSRYQTNVNSTLLNTNIWSTSGSSESHWSGNRHYNFAGAGTYSRGYVNGTIEEGGSNDWSYGYDLNGAWDPETESWKALSGSGSSSGSGQASFAYSGSGTHTESTTTKGSGYTATSSLTESWKESGNTGFNYGMSTNSTFAAGRWTTSGHAITSGSGQASWGYSGLSQFADNYSTTWITASGSGGTSSSNSSRDLRQLDARWGFQFTTESNLAADGTATTVTDSSASGSASGSRTYAASGQYDSWYAYSSSGGGPEATVAAESGEGVATETTTSTGSGSWYSWSNGESHSRYSQSIQENLQSEWQEHYTTTIGPGGATTTGSALGGTDATGHSHSESSGSDRADSGAGGPDYSYRSHSESASGLVTNDNYDYHAHWSVVYNPDGTVSVNSDASNHVTGDISQTWSNSWWWQSTSTGSSSGDSGGDGGSYHNSYGLVVSYPGFYSGAYFGTSWAWGGYGWGGYGWGGEPVVEGTGFYGFGPVFAGEGYVFRGNGQGGGLSTGVSAPGGIDLAGALALLVVLMGGGPGRPPGPPSGSNYAERFWETIPEADKFPKKSIPGIEVNHTYPDDQYGIFERRFRDEKGINIHDPAHLRGMTKGWHDVYTHTFQQWAHAQMKELKLDIQNVKHRKHFYETVKLEEVEKVREILMENEILKKRMLEPSASKKAINEFLEASGHVGDVKKMQRTAKETVKAAEQMQKSLGKKFPNLAKYFTTLAVFLTLAQGVSIAANIVNEPPHVKANREDFMDLYEKLLYQSRRGPGITKSQWWDLIQKLQTYLESADIDNDYMKVFSKWLREYIGPPNEDIWP